MWLNICQGLLVAGWTVRLIGHVSRALLGQKRVEASGAFGVFVAVVWAFFAAVIAWRAGAVSTIVGVP